MTIQELYDRGADNVFFMLGDKQVHYVGRTVYKIIRKTNNDFILRPCFYYNDKFVASPLNHELYKNPDCSITIIP
jgi:hypothetical protein